MSLTGAGRESKPREMTRWRFLQVIIAVAFIAVGIGNWSARTADRSFLNPCLAALDAAGIHDASPEGIARSNGIDPSAPIYRFAWRNSSKEYWVTCDLLPITRYRGESACPHCPEPEPWPPVWTPEPLGEEFETDKLR